MISHQPIVVTGTGLVTGLGLSREQTWDALLAMQSAMKPLTALESPIAPGKLGGQASELPADYAPDLPREVRYLRWTLDAALLDAGVPPGNPLPYPPDRCTVLLGTTLHGMRAAGAFFRSGEFSHLDRLLAGATLAPVIHGRGFAGLAATTCSACSSSLGSVALAVTLLQTGQADFVVAGGYDTISEYVYGGFNSLRLIADGPLRPFARGREGMKLAEGYGLLVLERADTAAARGATPIATVLGWGESADAHHLTQPDPRGDGAARAMTAALQRAGRTPEQIDLVAAHATGTPDNDAGEHAALNTVFGEDLPQTPVVAFKSQLGHTLGGAGAVELILSATALREGVLPATANTQAEEVEFADLRLTLGSPQPSELRSTLNTSLGFGGANTAVVLGRAPDRASVAPDTADETVYITGVGIVLPGCMGSGAATLAAIGNDTDCRGNTVPPADLDGLLNARRVRRMSEYVKLTLAATTLACRDAGIADLPDFARTCAAVLGSTHGSSSYSETYYRQIVTEGLASANPALFAEAVPNAAAAQLSLMLSLKGACQTVIGTRTAGLDALLLATARLRSGVWQRAIVSAGEEFSPLVAEAYRRCDPATRLGAGAVTLVLETAASMQERGAKPWARVLATGAGSGDPDQLLHTLQQVAAYLPGVSVISCSAGQQTRLGRVEHAALRRAGLTPASTAQGRIADTCSAAPLLALLAATRAADASAPGGAALAGDAMGLASGAVLERC